MSNVCKFLPPPRTAHQLQTINFVYEKHPQSIPPCPHATVYRVHLVTQGEGEVRVGNTVARVREGDVFFTFPAMPYHILAGEGMQYLYISYLGVRAAAETERCGITSTRFVFEGFDEQKVFWLHALETREELVDLAAESVLLSTLALIGSRALRALPALTQSNGNFALVKAYIDEHFCDPALCIEQIGDYFSYNKKYISTLFKKQMKVGISEYIRTLRLNRAAELLETGEQGIAEIAYAVGFRDPLYFSKLFKLHTGYSPRKYLSQTR
jgi:AraC-like DNA-binding protein/quercetin dioxygenase-like cupin family protein